MADMEKGPVHGDFVPVIFARNLFEAEFYKSLLEAGDVEVLIEDEFSEIAGIPAMTKGVPVLVPEDQLDEAQAVIADRHDLEERIEADTDGEDDEVDADDDDEDLMPPLDTHDGD